MLTAMPRNASCRHRGADTQDAAHVLPRLCSSRRAVKFASELSMPLRLHTSHLPSTLPLVFIESAPDMTP